MQSSRVTYLIFVIFKVPLQVQVEPAKKVLNVGEALILSCQIIGHPISSVVWLKDGQHVPSDRIHYADIQRVSTLSISAIRSEDKGMYQCFAHNERNVVQSTAQIILGGRYTNASLYFLKYNFIKC